MKRSAYRAIKPFGLLVAVFSMMALVWSSAAAALPTLTAQGGNVAVGATASVPIVLSDAPNGVAGFDLVVTLGNGNVANINNVSIPGFGLVSHDLVSGTEVRLRGVDLQGLIGERGDQCHIGYSEHPGVEERRIGYPDSGSRIRRR